MFTLLLALAAPIAADEKSFVAPDSKLEKLWGEGSFTEGPVEGPDGNVYFSDIGNRIMKFDPKTGKATEFRNPSGRANGLKFDAMGRLIACEGANTGGNRRVSITEKDGTVKTLADKYEGKALNSPNDLTLDSKGRIYFSDPRYVGSEKRELDHDSVYRIDPDGKLTLVIKDVIKPNGLVISPDGKTLYVADHSGHDRRHGRERTGCGHLLLQPGGEKNRVLTDPRGSQQLLFRGRGPQNTVHHCREVAVPCETDAHGEVTSRTDPRSGRHQSTAPDFRQEQSSQADLSPNADAISMMLRTMQPVPPASSAGVSLSAHAGPAMSM
jgi:hypothetical protein